MRHVWEILGTYQLWTPCFQSDRAKTRNKCLIKFNIYDKIEQFVWKVIFDILDIIEEKCNRVFVYLYFCNCRNSDKGTKEGERINCWRNIRRGAVTGTNCSHVIHLTAKQRKTTKVLSEKNMIFLFTEIQKKCHQQFGRWTFPHLHSKFPLVAFILKFLSNGIPVKYKSTTQSNIIFKKNARKRRYFLVKN